MTEHLEDLNNSKIVADFIKHTLEEEPRLGRELNRLDANGKRELQGVLARFDQKNDGVLGVGERTHARRLLNLLREPGYDVLVVFNKVLDYMDLNANARIEESEFRLCIEVLTTFSKAESDNDTLSERELRGLYAVLRYLDKDDSHSIDKDELRALRHALENPKTFFGDQMKNNPHYREAFG